MQYERKLANQLSLLCFCLGVWLRECCRGPTHGFEPHKTKLPNQRVRNEYHGSIEWQGVYDVKS